MLKFSRYLYSFKRNIFHPVWFSFEFSFVLKSAIWFAFMVENDRIKDRKFPLLLKNKTILKKIDYIYLIYQMLIKKSQDYFSHFSYIIYHLYFISLF
jgi:hypothetical protein